MYITTVLWGVILQKKLTFDDAPTANSSNPVKSSGIKTAIDNAVANMQTGLNALAVGSYSYLRNNSGSKINVGAVVDGSNLYKVRIHQASDSNYENHQVQESLTGSWKNMMSIDVFMSGYGIFKRVA